MNKLLIISAGLASMIMSVNVSATAIANNTDGVTLTVGETGSGATNEDCQLLNEVVTLNLSSNVTGGYACNEATNVIAVATCHPNGRKPDEVNNNIYVGSSAGGSVTSETPDTVCDADGAAADGKAVTKAGTGS